MNMLALGVVLLGTLMTVLGSYTLNISLPDMVGILCGATTNTPALGAAQQTLKQMGLEASTPALGCAVAYPLGVVGVIFAVLIIRKALARKEDLELKEKDDANKTYIAAFQVHNPAIFDKSIKEIGGLNYPKFVILPSVAGRQCKHPHFREDNQGRRPLAGGDFGEVCSGTDRTVR